MAGSESNERTQSKSVNNKLVELAERRAVDFGNGLRRPWAEAFSRRDIQQHHLAADRRSSRCLEFL